MPNGYGYTDETGQRVSALRDMFDGGGPGQSGDQFRGGGGISALANALKIRPLGSTAPREQIGFRGRIGSREYFRDMFDGGGAGRSSSAGFEGGPYSGLGNVLMDIGLLRPLGAHRGAQAAPMMRPSGVGANPLSSFGVDEGLRPNFDETPLQGATAGGTGVAPPSDITATPLNMLTAGGQPISGAVARALANAGSPSFRVGRDVMPAAPADAPVATPPMNPALYDMMARRFGSLRGIGFGPENIMAQSRMRYGVGGF